jgi:hypothetical protein
LWVIPRVGLEVSNVGHTPNEHIDGPRRGSFERRTTPALSHSVIQEPGDLWCNGPRWLFAPKLRTPPLTRVCPDPTQAGGYRLLSQKITRFRRITMSLCNTMPCKASTTTVENVVRTFTVS